MMNVCRNDVQRDDAARALLQVQKHHPEGRAKALEVLAAHGSGATTIRDLPLRHYFDVYQGARALHCAPPVDAVLAKAHLRAFRSFLSPYDPGDDDHADDFARDYEPCKFRDADTDALNEQDREYQDAKAVDPERAFPLVAELETAESRYVNTMAGAMRWFLNGVQINGRLGRKRQLDNGVFFISTAQSVADFARGPNQLELLLSERIEARYSEGFYLRLHHALAKAWIEAEQQFRRREAQR